MAITDTVTDVTVTPPTRHQIVIAAANVPAFLADIDDTAPEGKLASSIAVGIAGNGDITLTVQYAP